MNQRAPRRRRTLFCVILLTALAVTTALLLEVGVRLVAVASPTVRLLTWPRAEEAEEKEYRSLEDLLESHSMGRQPGAPVGGRYRDRLGLPSAELSPDPALSVVIVGDSFVFNDYPPGWLWPELLRGELAQTQDGPVDVLTYALPGIGPSEYRVLWEEAGRAAEPDVLLISFFLGNDFRNFNSLRGESQRSWSRFLQLIENTGRLLKNRRATGDTMASSPNPAAAPVGGAAFGKLVAGYEERYVNKRPTLAEEFYRPLKSEVLNIFSVQNQDLLRLEVARVVRLLGEICRGAESAGTRCAVVLFPDEVQVEEELRTELLQALERSGEAFDFAAPSELLAGELARAGVEVVDVLPCLRNASEGKTLYRPRDTHLNRRGNLLAGECVAAFLMSAEH